jgi:phenol 2-monooxygenase
MAETFIKDRIILAGDACHTHSSGSAQGLNTVSTHAPSLKRTVADTIHAQGIFDATNLAWKLAMFLKGTGTRELLDSYSTERMAVVNQMIENDKIISTLISGQLPPKFAGRTEPPRQILDEWFEQPANLAFTLGLGVGYPANNAVNEASTDAAPLCSISAGQRGPETYVSRLGTGERIPLQRAMPNDATFYAVIFTGVPSGTNTRASILSLRAWFNEHPEADWRKIFGRKTVKTLALVGAAGPSAYEALGNVASFGATLYDATLEAHHAYGGGSVTLWGRKCPMTDTAVVLSSRSATRSRRRLPAGWFRLQGCGGCRCGPGIAALFWQVSPWGKTGKAMSQAARGLHPQRASRTPVRQ